MIRSFHYAGQSAEIRLTRDLGSSLTQGDRAEFDGWLTFWHRWISGAFLNAYLEASGPASYLPVEREKIGRMLDFFLLEKAIYELAYEANSRPDWVDIPAQGILDILNTPR
jgi:predicted trehalose synthase